VQGRLPLTARPQPTGGLLTLSTVAIPTILKAPSTATLLAQFKGLYGIGAALSPNLGLFSLACALLHSYLYPGPSRGLLAAGLLSAGVIPFTMLVILPTNKRLFELEEMSRKGGVADESRAEIVRLLTRWSWLNAGRAVLPFAGWMVAAIAFRN